MRTPTGATRGRDSPIGRTFSVPIMPTGTTGAPVDSARRATPGLPR